MKTTAVFEPASADVDPDAHAIEAEGRVVDLVSRLPSAPVRIVVQSAIDEAADRETLRLSLLATPASSSPKFFYDEQGAALFTAICALDEYYPTRTEQRIFDTHRDAIADALPPGSQWVDLGCGDSAKARGWLDAAHVRRYVGVDIAESWLRASLGALAVERECSTVSRPRHHARIRGQPLGIVGVATDFTRPLDLHALLAEQPELPPVFFYPGSSIGNFTHDEAVAFLAAVREHIERHRSSGRSAASNTSGKLLIGVDLVKDRDALVAAYDDALGVTAAFDRNVLRVANRLLDADFDPSAFSHRAVFDEEFSRIEMQLVSTRAQTVRIGDRARRFEENEVIVTEYSHKYTMASFAAVLAEAGFAVDGRLRIWTDERGWFGVFVAEPA